MKNLFHERTTKLKTQDYKRNIRREKRNPKIRKGKENRRVFPISACRLILGRR